MPELMLTLVHSRTLRMPQDTVRAWGPGRGRQSGARGMILSPEDGDTSPGNPSEFD
jgi:hypothetical protein